MHSGANEKNSLTPPNNHKTHRLGKNASRYLRQRGDARENPMDPVEPTSDISKEPVKSVSRNPLSNLRTLLKGKIPQINIPKPSVGFRPFVIGVSVLLNLALLWVVIALGNHLFTLRGLVAETLLETVSKSVGLSADAQIETTVNIQEELPVSFNVPLQQDTLITLSQPTRIENASLSIRSATLSIDAPTVITLPVGAELPITLDITVPVSATVPVDLTIPLQIPLANSELGESFTALQSLVDPYEQIVSETPGCWQMLLWGGDCP
jgi:hypothetical protein